jgi:hypothetical protein
VQQFLSTAHCKMATRLYPNTKSKTKVELLAGVRPGTYDRLKALVTFFNENYPENYEPLDLTNQSEERSYILHSMKQCDFEISKLDDFLLYGWGRVDFGGLILPEDQQACGGTTSLEDCRYIFKAMYLDENLLLYTEGLHWC